MKINIFIIACLATLTVSCQKEKITKNGLANDHFYLQANGQRLPVTVGGNVDSKKFIIIIHGGPGGNGMSYRDNFVREKVENQFAMVYFDQRFAGNSQGKKAGSDISDFRKDIRNLILLLKSKYGNDNKFYLLGHSWGGFLAPYFLIEPENQNLVDGWIQVGGAHNYRLNDSMTREMLIHYGEIEIQANNNQVEWEEIVNWCKNNGFESRNEAGTLNGFAHRAEGLIEEVIYPFFEFSRNHEAFTLHFFNQINSAIRAIDNPTYSTPNSDKLNQITLPTLLLWGKFDFVCPPGLAEDIENNISSSDVTKIIYPHSGHSPMANQPSEFWNNVVLWVYSH